MANKIYKDMRLKIDGNASSVLVDITAYLSSASIRSTQDLIEDTAMADDEKQFLFGQAGATIPLAGMVNSTTDSIFGPLIGNRTSITSTIEYRAYSTNSTGSVGRFYNGEVLISSVEYSGSTNALQTFSAEATFDGSINRTSAQL